MEATHKKVLEAIFSHGAVVVLGFNPPKTLEGPKTMDFSRESKTMLKRSNAFRSFGILERESKMELIVIIVLWTSRVSVHCFWDELPGLR